MKLATTSLMTLFVLLLAACPSSQGRPEKDPNAPSAAFLVGTWKDNDQTAYTFAEQAGEVRLVDIVDDDGERFELRSFGYRDGYFAFTYFVPSTGYVVTIRVLETEGDELEADWTNSANETGPERLVKQLE